MPLLNRQIRISQSEQLFLNITFTSVSHYKGHYYVTSQDTESTRKEVG